MQGNHFCLPQQHQVFLFIYFIYSFISPLLLDSFFHAFTYTYSPKPAPTPTGISWIRKTIEISEQDTTESVKEKIVEKVVRQMEGEWEWGEVVGWELGVEGGKKVPEGERVFRFFFLFFCLFVCCLFVWLFVWLFVCLFVCVFVRLSFPYIHPQILTFSFFLLPQIYHKTRPRTPLKTKTICSSYTHPSPFFYFFFRS